MRRTDPSRAAGGLTKAVIALVLAASFAAAVPATEPDEAAGRAASANDRCDVGAVQLTQAFAGSPRSACTRLGPARFRLTVTPERPDINPSPWYAFELHGVRSNTASAAEVILKYTESRHRYRPKVRVSESAWTTLADGAVRVGEVSGEARLVIPLARSNAAAPVRVAAQEVLDVSERAHWRREFAEHAGFSLSVIGRSARGRPIEALYRKAAVANPPLVVVLGGQHPPEVPGVLGMRAFLEALVRSGGVDRIEWLVVPNLNPDGVDAGHWRLNAGGVDLNRDWGPFTQAETRAARDAIAERVASGSRAVVLLDFHATRRDVLYLPKQSEALDPSNLAGRWAGAIGAAMPSGRPAFAQSRSHGHGRPTAKAWFAETYGAPGITVEFGDETDRARIDRLAAASAQALLNVLAEDGF